jgi:hypothetical protein
MMESVFLLTLRYLNTIKAVVRTAVGNIYEAVLKKDIAKPLEFGDHGVGTMEMTSKAAVQLQGKEHPCILDFPSKEAMEGSIFFQYGNKKHYQKITATRPSHELQQEFQEALGYPLLEDIWYPTCLAGWSYGIIHRYVIIHADTQPEMAVPATQMLAAGRFGEAQLCGASEEVMQTVLEELLSNRFRTHQQWNELVNPDNLISTGFSEDFKSEKVRFIEPRAYGTRYDVHELALPIQATGILKFAAKRVDEALSQMMARIRHQAFVGPIKVNDLKEDDQSCPICLMGYEEEQHDSNENKPEGPLYDCMKDNRKPVKLTCGHIFGTTCIERWLFENNACCMCRAVVNGHGRKLNPIAQEQLSAITSYEQARDLIYFEGIDWEPECHEYIEEVIQRRNLGAVDLLEQIFELLKEIDLRLGMPRGNTSTPVATWMNKDWLKLSSHVLAVIELIDELNLPHGRVPGSAVDRMMGSLTAMLFANAERWLL